MTALLQLTDVMTAAKKKKILWRKKHELKKLLRRKSISENKRPVYKCGPREIMWMVNEIGKEMEKWNEEEEYILKGLRQTGMLAYRPDFEKGCLVPATGDWCEKFPLGEGGKVEADWLQAREGSADPTRLEQAEQRSPARGPVRSRLLRPLGAGERLAGHSV